MSRTITFLALVCALAGQSLALAQEWGDLVGKVVIRFRVPPAIPQAITAQGVQIADESLLVAQDGGLANVVIYLRTSPVPAHPQLAADIPPHATIVLKNSSVQPRISPVWIGQQTVVFGNQDMVSYNLNVQPLGDVAINSLLRPQDVADFKPAREQAIPVPMGCNIQPWIRGYLLPRNNPYVAVTDAKGEFKLAKLPAAALEFQLWHEKFGYLDTPLQPKGRFTMQIKPGANDLGTIVVER